MRNLHLLLATHNNWGLLLLHPRGSLGVGLGLGLTYVAAMWSMQRCRNSTWGLYVTRMRSDVHYGPLPQLLTPDPSLSPTQGSINMRILHSPLRWPWTDMACTKKTKKKRAQETGADLGLRYLHNSQEALRMSISNADGVVSDVYQVFPL